MIRTERRPIRIRRGETRWITVVTRLAPPLVRQPKGAKA